MSLEQSEEALSHMADGMQGYSDGLEGAEPVVNQSSLPGDSEHAEAKPYSVDNNLSTPDEEAPTVKEGEDDDEAAAEYDPDSVAILYPDEDVPEFTDSYVGTDPAGPAAAQAPKPKTAAGFVVDSSDDDEEGGSKFTAIAESAALSSRDSQANAQIQNVQSPAMSKIAPPASKPNTHSAAASEAPSMALTSAVRLVPNGSGPNHPAASIVSTPLDVADVLELRVKRDHRGDMDAWLDLIKEYRQRNALELVRSTYSRFLKIFPHAADMWVENLRFELDLSNFTRAEDIFRQCLMAVPSVKLWTTYLDYIRRRHDLSDSSGEARRTITQAYEFVLDNVGIDRDSGPLWQDYLQFLRNGPGQIGGSAWQDQQKMDQLRKTYQKAVRIPTSTILDIWKDYEQFEMGLNKMTGRKFIQEKSAIYMNARSAYTALVNATNGLVRSTLPQLPPAPGFEGDAEYQTQVELWKKWTSWEKSDPLDLKKTNLQIFQQRVLHVYKQALMALRFWPDMWIEAATWCFENEVVRDGKNLGLIFLEDGIRANPESVLLALTLGDRIEATYPAAEGNEAKAAFGKAVRAPYDTVLNYLYGMVDELKERENAEITRLGSLDDGNLQPLPLSITGREDNDEENHVDSSNLFKKSKTDTVADRIALVKKGFAVQMDLVKKAITFLWIALFRAMRRIQGKGSTKAGALIPGARGLFQEARGRGRLTSDIYAAVAQVEWNVYQDPSATKIFDRGAKLFPNDELYLLEYLKHLHARHDTTNARVVFETCTNRLTQTPDLVHKAKPLFAYFHKYESYYGDLSQIAKLEKRMAELFPEDSQLACFSSRFSADGGFGMGHFDPVSTRLIVSPEAQMRPKMSTLSCNATTGAGSPLRPAIGNSPRTQLPVIGNSPKRPYSGDDDDHGRPHKMMRGEPPVKGAAGRRLHDTQSRGSQPIARDITFIMSQIPGPEVYNGPCYRLDKALLLAQTMQVPSHSEFRTVNQGKAGGGGHSHKGSSDFQRNTNAPGGRPISPFARQAIAGTNYRNSPLRAEAGVAASSAVAPAFDFSVGFPPPLPQAQMAAAFANLPTASAEVINNAWSFVLQQQQQHGQGSANHGQGQRHGGFNKGYGGAPNPYPS